MKSASSGPYNNQKNHALIRFESFNIDFNKYLREIFILHVKYSFCDIT